jgi:hypothetical protein
MAIVDLSGTPVVRYPDPPVPRVLPNGVQPYSAYEAPMVYLSGTKGTPAVVCNIVLTGIPAGATTFFPLLFGTDYPASVQSVEYMSGTIFGYTGAPLPITDPSFFGDLATSTDAAPVFSSLIPSTETPADLRYQQIVRGITVTNGVAVSGFPVYAQYDNYGLCADFSQTASANTIFSLRVLMNGAVINSSSPFIGQTYQPAPTDLTLPTSLPNYPIILWEGDFTQAIVDSGFKIAGNVLIAGDLLPATLDVVGIWTAPTYTPPT